MLIQVDKFEKIFKKLLRQCGKSHFLRHFTKDCSIVCKYIIEGFFEMFNPVQSVLSLLPNICNISFTNPSLRMHF
jgi:hypothetical protein